jgi:WXXGXW repeat (2 copies)
MRFGWLALGVVACNSFNYHTHEFVAGTACGQGPYDVHLPVDGTTAEDGVEVFACTSHEIAGHVEVEIGKYAMADETFGSGADNRRCVATGAVVAATESGSPSSSSPVVAGSGETSAAPVLIEESYDGTESAFDEDLCKALGLPMQQILPSTTVGRDLGEVDLAAKGADMHVRIWSDVPNDLAGVIFMVRQLTSTHAPRKPEKVDPPDPSRHVAITKPPPPSHGAPPPPLVEEKPERTSTAATWIAGYWTWTGAEWGWIAGFWRDAADTPAPRIETPGTAPQPSAIWIGGLWRRSGGGWTWIGGRWRTR